MTIPWRNIAPAVGLLLAFGLISKCQSDNWSRERDELVAAADSLRGATLIDSALAAAALSRADSLQEVAAQATEAAQGAVRTADILRAERRRLLAAAGRQGAGATDTVVVPDTAAALVLCDQETVVLRKAIDAGQVALQAAHRETAELRGALSLETAAAAGLRRSNADLSRMLASADPPCRMLWFRCPSRTVVAIGGVVVGAVGAAVVIR